MPPLHPLARIALAAAALLPGATASAAPPAYEHFRVSERERDSLTSKTYNQCIDASGGVTIALRDCAAAEMNRLDRELNIAYRDALSRLAAPAREDLRALERRWLVSRWKACRREADREGGGTLALVILDSCEVSELQRRILWLRRYAI